MNSLGFLAFSIVFIMTLLMLVALLIKNDKVSSICATIAISFFIFFIIISTFIPSMYRSEIRNAEIKGKLISELGACVNDKISKDCSEKILEGLRFENDEVKKYAEDVYIRGNQKQETPIQETPEKICFLLMNDMIKNKCWEHHECWRQFEGDKNFLNGEEK